jgi:hypothetical protein
VYEENASKSLSVPALMHRILITRQSWRDSVPEPRRQNKNTSLSSRRRGLQMTQCSLHLLESCAKYPSRRHDSNDSGRYVGRRGVDPSGSPISSIDQLAISRYGSFLIRLGVRFYQVQI